MEKEVYLANPCKASSLSFWKTNLINIPDNMKIVSEEDMMGVPDAVEPENYAPALPRVVERELSAVR